MGWQDRDYSQYLDDGPAVFSARPIRRNRAALALLIVHIAAAVVLLSLMFAGTNLGAAQLAIAAPDPAWWTILTHPFASVDFFRVLLTCLILWVIAPRIEEIFGRTRLLQSYFLGNVAAGAVFWGVARVRPSWTGQPLDYPVGAGIAWLVLYWQLARHEMTMIVGKPLRVGHVIAAIGGIMVLLALAVSGLGAIGWLVAAVVGGAAGILQPLQLNIRLPRRRPRIVHPPEPTLSYKLESRDTRPVATERELDQLLAKISKDGLESLTPKDRARLEVLRQMKLRHEI